MAKYNQKAVWLDKMHTRDEEQYSTINRTLEKSIGKLFRKRVYKDLSQSNKSFMDFLSNIELFELKEVFDSDKDPSNYFVYYSGIEPSKLDIVSIYPEKDINKFLEANVHIVCPIKLRDFKFKKLGF